MILRDESRDGGVLNREDDCLACYVTDLVAASRRNLNRTCWVKRGGHVGSAHAKCRT